MPNNRLSLNKQELPTIPGYVGTSNNVSYLRNLEGHVPEEIGYAGANCHDPNSPDMNVTVDSRYDSESDDYQDS